MPLSSQQAGHPIQAAFRHLRFQVKEKLSDQERQQVRARRKRQGKRGATPKYRHTHFRVRAAILLDTARQAADAARRERRIRDYETQLDWVRDHLNKGRYYSDPEWVAGRLADLAHQFKDVRTLVQVRFQEQGDGTMSLTHQRRPERIAQAARLDGKWVLVGNQPLRPGQSQVDYMDWMLGVYKNHRHVERRMRNLKSDRGRCPSDPIRPIYVHRDDALVALCFVSVVALMVYTLIERDCQADPALVEAGLRTTDHVLDVLSGFCLTVFFCPSGDEYFWFDTPTAAQVLIWQQLGLADPGTRASDGHLAGLTGQEGEPSSSSVGLTADNSLPSWPLPGQEVWSPAGACCPWGPYLTIYAAVKVLIVMLC